MLRQVVVLLDTAAKLVCGKSFVIRGKKVTVEQWTPGADASTRPEKKKQPGVLLTGLTDDLTADDIRQYFDSYQWWLTGVQMAAQGEGTAIVTFKDNTCKLTSTPSLFADEQRNHFLLIL